MLVFLENQAVSLVRPFKCLLPEICCKGHWKCSLALLFFSCKYVFGGQCLEWLGQCFPGLLSRSVSCSLTPIKGFVSSKKNFTDSCADVELAFQGVSASLAHGGSHAVHSPSLLYSPHRTEWTVALAPAPRPPDSSMEDKGTEWEEKVFFGRDASNFYSIPHLQYTEFLKNAV